MTTHAIRVSAAKDVSLTEAQATVDDWISNYSKILEVEESSISVANTEIDGSGTEYFSGTYRFLSSDSKSGLLDDIETRLNSAVSWYQVKYHQCPHDESEGGACPPYTVERESGTIPNSI